MFPLLYAGMAKETVILVEGEVTKRAEETVNNKIDTGLIEVRASKIEVLGPCKLGLPFEIDSSMQTREDVRLKYRYLDLRNRKIHDNIVLRSKILSYLRRQMEDLGFMEIQPKSWSRLAARTKKSPYPSGSDPAGRENIAFSIRECENFSCVS